MATTISLAAKATRPSTEATATTGSMAGRETIRSPAAAARTSSSSTLSQTGINTVTDFKVGNDHFQLLEGLTVESLANMAAGDDLTLSTGGHTIFMGVHVNDWHALL